MLFYSIQTAGCQLVMLKIPDYPCLDILKIFKHAIARRTDIYSVEGVEFIACQQFPLINVKMQFPSVDILIVNIYTVSVFGDDASIVS